MKPPSSKVAVAASSVVRTSSASKEFVELVWRSFFSERRRGTHLDAHFPWFATADERTSFIELHGSERVLGGLAMREYCSRHLASRARVMALGLVCVQPDCRMRGIATHIVAHALSLAATSGIAACTLWTRNHALYTKTGFAPFDNALFGTVGGLRAGPLRATDIRSSSWPDDAERRERNRGLPPFAESAFRCETADGSASAIVLQGASGPIVAEWTGHDVAAADLLTSRLAGQWQLNALDGDGLPVELRRRGAILDLNPTGLQMWHMLKSHPDLSTSILALSLRVLDRI